MALTKRKKKVLRALSIERIDVESARKIANIKGIHMGKNSLKKLDVTIMREEYEIPLRIFFPNEEIKESCEKGVNEIPVMLYLHGGGWATDDADNYDRICYKLARAVKQIVIVVDYRLAPEHKFPTGLLDCYEVAKVLFADEFIFPIQSQNITIIGDSAGGNLVAALCQKGRDEGAFYPEREILIYPATNNDYSEESPFESVRQNGTDYILTSGKMRDYLTLYERDKEDRNNPYFAPILATDFHNLPRTLIVTAEYDLLRDEGEAYGYKLKEAGVEVQMYRVADAIHGFFGVGLNSLPVKETLHYIAQFLKEEL